MNSISRSRVKDWVIRAPSRDDRGIEIGVEGGVISPSSERGIAGREGGDHHVRGRVELVDCLEICAGRAVGADRARLGRPGQRGIGFCGRRNLGHDDIDGIFRKIARECAASVGAGAGAVGLHAVEHTNCKCSEQHDAAKYNNECGTLKRIWLESFWIG